MIRNLTTSDRNTDEARIQDLQTKYDSKGNVVFTANLLLSSSPEGFSRDSREFLYDSLDRLTRTVEGDFDVENARYLANGNIERRLPSGKSPGEFLFYDYEDSSHPHAISSARFGGHGNSFIDNSFEYDNHGNRVRELRENGRSVVTTEYTGFNKPKKHTFIEPGIGSNEVTMEYDASETRVVKRSEGRVTFYVGNEYEKRVGKKDFDSGSGSVTQHIYHIYGGSRQVAQVLRTESRGGLETIERYLHVNYLGTTQTITDGSGAVVFVNDTQDIDGGDRLSGDVRIGFTGHEHDIESTFPSQSFEIGGEPEGFINMRGRIFDPRMRTFLSPDPLIQAPRFSQSYNRYTYTFNNPTTLTDPSGYAACSSGRDVTGSNADAVRDGADSCGGGSIIPTLVGAALFVGGGFIVTVHRLLRI